MTAWCCCCVHEARRMRRSPASLWCAVLFCRLTQKVMQHAEAVLRPVMQAMLSRVILGQETESKLPEDWADLIHQV